MRAPYSVLAAAMPSVAFPGRRGLKADPQLERECHDQLDGTHCVSALLLSRQSINGHELRRAFS